MSVYGDGLSAFGNAQTVEIPPDLSVTPYGGIRNTNDATAKNPLGTLYRYKGNLYRYVKFVKQTNSNAASEGVVVNWHTTQFDPRAGKFSVTGDNTYVLGGLNTVAGVFTCAVTDGYYTWMQVGGRATAIVVTGTVHGDVLIGQANDDQEFNMIAADSEITSVPFAVAFGARNLLSNTAAYVLLFPHVLASF